MYIFNLKSFNDLSNAELYEILQLRETVFVVEQNCVYHDIDGIDSSCQHIFATTKNTKKIIAYARLVPANLKFETPSIGRVICHQNYRSQGLGKALMQQAIITCYQLYGKRNIKISAQVYLRKFYRDLGFEEISEPYDEDGIEHVDMILENFQS